MMDCDGAIVTVLLCIEGKAELDNVDVVGGGGVDDKKVGCKVVGT